MASWMKPTVYSLICVLLCVCSVLQTTEARRESSYSTKLTYYVHEIRTGENVTVLTAAGPGDYKWGSLLVIDNLVRSGESPSSTLIGGSTGFGVITTKAGITGGIMSVNTITFNEASKYNASTLSLIATVATATPPYQAIVLGGTGHFHTLRGYALATPGVASPPSYPTKWEVYLSRN